MVDDPYDLLPYTDHAYAESHPDRLAVVARLAGWHPPSVETARILEVGCARGGNLLPMAESLPRATLVGIDRSRGQVEQARRIARETGLGNVAFHAASFDEVDLAPSSFDFIVCHGLYSWIPALTRQALLRHVSTWLAPRGVAYVSLNTLPGWYERLAARDWLQFARAELDKPAETPGASLRWLRERVSPELSAYRGALERVDERIVRADPSYVVHEYLAADHHPVHVTAFLGEAATANLSYLGDAIPASTALELADDEIRAQAGSLGVAETQQLLDFVRCTPFRRALLVRTDTATERGWRWPAALDVRALDGMRVASRLEPSARPEQFDGATASVNVSDASARRALQELSAVAPRSMAFDDLYRRVTSSPAQRDRLRSELFDLWLAMDDLDVHFHEPPMLTTAVSQRPRAGAVARWQAANGGVITNLWHQEVAVAEDAIRVVLARLDGERSLDALARDLKSAPIAAGCSDDELRRLVAASLDSLARAALLVSS